MAVAERSSEATDIDTVDRRELLAVGALAAALTTIFLAPFMSPGALLHFDLVATRHFELTAGWWGIGPELPRLGPVEIVLAMVASVVGGATTVTASCWVALVAATVGAHRLARQWGAAVGPAIGAAMLYAFGPWVITRLAVGHLTMIGVAAVLPWVVADTTRDAVSARSVVRGSAVLAVFGFFGGMVAVLVLGTIGLTERLSPKVSAMAAAVHLPWLVPSLLVFTAPGSAAGSGAFPSGVDEPLDVAGLLAGRGFWQDRLQVGGDTDLMAAALGVAVVALAVLGVRRIHGTRRVAALLLVVVPTAIVVAGATPGLRAGFDAITDVGPFVVLREPQRLMVVPLLLLAVLAAVGVTTVADRAAAWQRPSWTIVLPVLAIVTCAPGVPHLRDVIDPTPLPPEWERAREEIAAAPGSVLVLPWQRYLDIGLVDGRRVLNPALAYFGGDVRIPGDLGLAEPSEERRDARAAALEAALPALRGETRAGVLADLGIDWVLLLHEIDYQVHLTLLDDPALESVIAAGSLDLFRVRPYGGPAQTLDGEAATLRHPIAPIALVDQPGSVVWDQPYQWGWFRGFDHADRSADGRLVLSGDAGIVWYAPALFVVAAYGIAAVSVLGTGRRPIESDAS